MKQIEAYWVAKADFRYLHKTHRDTWMRYASLDEAKDAVTNDRVDPVTRAFRETGEWAFMVTYVGDTEPSVLQIHERKERSFSNTSAFIKRVTRRAIGR
jgi:hypothetical protein